MTAIHPLTDAERLILANQQEILSRLDADNADHHQRLAAQLRKGHASLYEAHFAHVLEPVMDWKITDPIDDILTAYSVMRTVAGPSIKFPGYDGNNEVEQRGYVQALRDDGKYVDVIGDGLPNSHAPMTEAYARMVAKWKTLSHKGIPTQADVEAILAERYTPKP